MQPANPHNQHTTHVPSRTMEAEFAQRTTTLRATRPYEHAETSIEPAANPAGHEMKHKPVDSLRPPTKTACIVECLPRAASHGFQSRTFIIILGGILHLNCRINRRANYSLAYLNQHQAPSRLLAQPVPPTTFGSIESARLANQPTACIVECLPWAASHGFQSRTFIIILGGILHLNCRINRRANYSLAYLNQHQAPSRLLAQPVPPQPLAPLKAHD